MIEMIYDFCFEYFIYVYVLLLFLWFGTGKNEETLLTDGSIVLECCLTSNVLCGSVPNFEDHHFKKFYESGHSVVICVSCYHSNSYLRSQRNRHFI